MMTYVWRIAYTDAEGLRRTMSDVYLNERHAADSIEMFARNTPEAETFKDPAVVRFPIDEDFIKITDSE